MGFLHNAEVLELLARRPNEMGSSITLLPILLLAPPLVLTECCNKKSIGGTGPDSGNYWLESSNDSRCQDGCLYSKNNDTADIYCFNNVNRYVINCSSETREVDVSVYWNNQSIFTPDTLTPDKGNFSAIEMCAVGSYATGFELRYAQLCSRRCTYNDDTALLGIRLTCAAYDDTSTLTGTVSSAIAPDYRRYGRPTGFSWTSLLSCPSSRFLESADSLSELFVAETISVGGNFTCPPTIVCTGLVEKTNDPMGGMNVNAKCTDGTELHGQAIPQSARPDTSSWSTNSDSHCAEGHAVCGIESRLYMVDTTKNYEDSLGQTQVRFTCCQLPPGIG